MAVRGWDMTRYCVSSRVMLLHSRAQLAFCSWDLPRLRWGIAVTAQRALERARTAGGLESCGALGALLSSHCCHRSASSHETHKHVFGRRLESRVYQCVVMRAPWSSAGVTEVSHVSSSGPHGHRFTIALRHHARHTFIPAMQNGVCHSIESSGVLREPTLH